MEATNIIDNRNNIITNKQQIMAADVGLQLMNLEALIYQCGFPGCPLGPIPIFLLFFIQAHPWPSYLVSALSNAHFFIISF